jgi:hypothetical protein
MKTIDCVGRLAPASKSGATEQHPAGTHGAIFPPLEAERREVVGTEQAAFYLNLKPQTLRAWSCLGSGLLRPIRISNRLAWRTAEIRDLLAREAR